MKELFQGVGDFRSRVTVDLDTKNIFKLLYCIYKGIKMLKVAGIKIKPSTSKGYHVIFYTKNKLSNKKILQYRKKLGDDKMRLYYSQIEKPKQILFWKKKVLNKKEFEKYIQYHIY
jgi:hypothetical protein